jgi:hypothetical protein
LASTSLSYSFPIWKDVLRRLVFVDTAIVTDHELEQGELRVASGFGVRANRLNKKISKILSQGSIQTKAKEMLEVLKSRKYGALLHNYILNLSQREDFQRMDRFFEEVSRGVTNASAFVIMNQC